jgi:hypothetical protein
MKRVLKPFIAIVAIVYFLIDAVMMVLARPVAHWLSQLKLFAGKHGSSLATIPLSGIVRFAAHSP